MALGRQVAVRGLLMLVMVVVGWSVSAGPVINIDFGTDTGTYAGTAAAPDSGTKWNSVNGNVTNQALLDSTNAATAMTLTVAGASGKWSMASYNPSHVDPAVAVGSPGVYDALVRDQLYTNSSTATITLAGVPAGSYDLYCYEVRGNTNENTRFTVTSQTGSPSLVSTPDDALTTGFTPAEDYVQFTGLTPNASNQIVVQFTSAGATVFGAIVGLQLVAVPEPATLLVAAGLLLAAGLRRGRA